MSNLMEEFLIEYLKTEPYASKEDLVSVLSGIEFIIRYNKDKSLEELIDLIIEDNIEDFEMVRKKYGVPGYTASINVGNINVKLYGGNINYLGEPMPENALFDIASMTKFYTQIIAYNLMKEGVFKRSDRIIDLDSRFVNLGNLTIDDILTFGTKFSLDGLIKDKKTIDEAFNTLFNAKVERTGSWNYNDIGLMIIKEVMEKLTSMTYPELVDKYIIHPLHLTDTHIIVPRTKFKLITGTPNFSVGHINDMSANALGGYSGHAGIFASSTDLIRLMKGVRNKGIVPNLSDAYTPGKLNDAIAIMGNVYTSNPRGLEKTYVDVTEPRDTFAIAGSTRVNAASSADSTYNVLFNPSSMSPDEAIERADKINIERAKEGLKPISPVKEFEFDRDGKLVKYTLIDSRGLFPVDPMADVVRNVALSTLKLRFLDFAIKKYGEELEKIDVVRNTK